MQLFCPVDHPLRKGRTALRNLALRDRPVFNPATTLFSDEGVWQAVSLIAQRILQRDEAVSPLAQDFEQLSDVICFEVARVQQQNLFWFVADDLWKVALRRQTLSR